MNMEENGRLVLSEEVQHALSTHSPIVALESTIITHGMPHPTNLSTALSVESILRSEGVTPATIAILRGVVHVGLTSSQLERLSDPGLTGTVKVSRRDLGAVISMGLTGGTTVAGTMFIARSLGIGLFVTGGIGGVHRGAEKSMDISADLMELGRTPVAVVCAGAKSILDIPKTLEVLETQGVCVASYGDKHDFPAFYSPTSGYKSPWQVRDPTFAASLIHTNLNLPQPLSTLLAVPIPSSYTAAGQEVQESVEIAIRESVEQGIDKRGKEVTPWLLKRVGELSGGKALKLNNETLPQPTVLVFGAAAIDITSSASKSLEDRTTTPGEIRVSPGGVGRNIAEAAQNLLPPNSVRLISAIGATIGKKDRDTTKDNLTRQGQKGEEITDDLGLILKSEMLRTGLRTDGLINHVGSRTASCSLMLEKQDLVVGVADMDIIHNLTPDKVIHAIEQTPGVQIVAFDLNLKPESIIALLKTCMKLKIPTLCDPTSISKSLHLLKSLDQLPNYQLTHLSPNLLELEIISSHLYRSSNRIDAVPELNLDLNRDIPREVLESLSRNGWNSEIVRHALRLLKITKHVWLKGGPRGILHITLDQIPTSTTNSKSTSAEMSTSTTTSHLISKHSSQISPSGDHTPIKQDDSSEVTERVMEKENKNRFDIHISSSFHLMIHHHPPPHISQSQIVSTTGAGDTLVGGIIAGLLSGEKEEEWMNRAVERVGKTMRSRRAVG
ncbi:hypothetical protein TREMEDRAFT_68967 [Tremella mesenterica DSM 1558]|uniref:uncharacterized protein n=1 Tax=Tremella mesenterica (strain ATCC 24925 / CBS 8224 / DSM 1558 / NBRC 9311 / NRRL Y-6157 / RJB 2259-6 / UBC 559-6) TaxID=578456 RepID=UPI0003F49EAC|nr:uncharacterized protein TREMEDRAFT_68967 [Tremella mesenterica DSM 1558]EIW69105.1 hypothetical protein TREMEDRAFT_68967 [Tremella mesenterica DSM 1558]